VINEFRKKDFALDDSGESAEQVEDVHHESIEEILCRESDLKKLKNAIDRLPEQQRVVFVIWMTEGLSYDEICRQTGLSLDAVKSLIYRARQKLVKELRNEVLTGKDEGERGEP
jgi:RNA polymerase sigma-70 factor (ECF subfamily)